MGTYFHYAVVHGRVLIWWTDGDGTEREQWLHGPLSVRLATVVNDADFKIQMSIRQALQEMGINTD